MSMAPSVCLRLAFGICVVACLSSAAHLSERFTTMGTSKLIHVESNPFYFTVSTCFVGKLQLWLGGKRPDYFLMFNHPVNKNTHKNGVLLQKYFGDKLSTVMRLDQLYHLCHTLPKCFSVQIDKGLLIISEACSQRKNFTWPIPEANRKAVSLALASSPNANWVFAERPVCHTNRVPSQGFLKAHSIKLTTTKGQRHILNDHGFEFNDTGTTLKINLHSCDLALITIGESREGLFHEYYELLLNKHVAKINRNMTVLRRCKEARCSLIGTIGLSTEMKSCSGVQTFYIMMKPGEIGVGYACKKKSGLGWRIPRNHRSRFMGLFSTSMYSYTQWDISLDSCNTSFTQSNKPNPHHRDVDSDNTGQSPQKSGEKIGLQVNPTNVNSASNGSSMNHNHEVDEMSNGKHARGDVTDTDQRPVAGGGILSGLPDGKTINGGETSDLPDGKTSNGGETSDLPDGKTSNGGETSDLPNGKTINGGETSDLPDGKTSNGGETSGLPDKMNDTPLTDPDEENQKIRTTQKPDGGGTSENSGWSVMARNPQTWIALVLLPLANVPVG